MYNSFVVTTTLEIARVYKILKWNVLYHPTAIHFFISFKILGAIGHISASADYADLLRMYVG